MRVPPSTDPTWVRLARGGLGDILTEHVGLQLLTQSYPDAILRPTVGWISGVPLAELGLRTPKVYDGRTASKYTDGLVALHVELPPTQVAVLEIVNIFEPDERDVVEFAATGFEATDCRVNGVPQKLAVFMDEHGNDDCRRPLIGDYGGATINVSLQSIDAETGLVTFFAPVFADVRYHLARPPGDYAASFRARLAGYRSEGATFACNCILNFVYGELEGKPLGALHGPVTFGEIGYQLLNQTMVILHIE